jgi:hypothetical protein
MDRHRVAAMTPRALSAFALFVVGVALMSLVWVTGAWAHDVRPGAVSLREVTPHEFAVRLIDAQDGGPTPVRMVPRWPEHCREQATRLVCDGGLYGVMQLDGVESRRVKIMVSVTDLQGTRRQWLLREGERSVELSENDNAFHVGEFLWIGIEHIWWGPDHLLFVVALWLLAPTGLRCLWAATGFTVGHSLTLALVTFGWLAPLSQAVELMIAVSVFTLAVEVARLGVADADGNDHRADWWRKQTWTLRWPMLVGLIIGLIHGMGFAGALRDVGLPAGQELAALALFNAGVELGQLVVLIALGVLWHACGSRLPTRFTTMSRLVIAYGIGIRAWVWVMERAFPA